MNQTKIPISLLDLAVIREGQNTAEAIFWTVQTAQQAEALGFRRIWLAEHHNMPAIASSSTALLIGHVAGQTERIPVGSGGIMLPNHSNLSVAEDFGTLSHLYPGRIELGLGRAPGTDPLTAQALRPHAPAGGFYNFRENIRELERYFNKDNNAAVRAFMAEGRDVPFYILGSSTDSAWLAAELGLPYAFAAHFAPQHLAAASRIYKENFKPSKVQPEPYFIACINIIAAQEIEEAKFLASSLYQMFLGIMTNSRKPLQAPIEGFLEQLDPRLIQATEQMLYYTFIGNPESLNKELHQFIAHLGIDEIMTTSYLFDLEKRLENLALIKQALSQ